MSWQWRMIQKLKRNWLVILKLTWGDSQILTRVLESLKNLFQLAPCDRRIDFFELQKYKGVIFRDTEEICKFWRKSDLWFERRLEKFGKSSPEHLKVSKVGLWWDPFVQSRKGITLKFTNSCLSWQWRIIQNLKRNWLFISKLTWGI